MDPELVKLRVFEVSNGNPVEMAMLPVLIKLVASTCGGKFMVPELIQNESVAFVHGGSSERANSARNHRGLQLS